MRPGRHGIELVAVAGGNTFRVASDCEEAVRALRRRPPPDDLSPALLETLSVVAYLQPTTRAEVAQVRGVSSEWALGALSRARPDRRERPRRHGRRADPLPHDASAS